MAARVLIVDDHPSFRRSARALLEAEGFTVVAEAEDAAGALDAVARLRPDVVLLDVRLPDLDGFAVAQQLMRNGNPPLVILTSSRDADDYGDQIARSGARGFIAKGELSGQALAVLLR